MNTPHPGLTFIYLTVLRAESFILILETKDLSSQFTCVRMRSIRHCGMLGSKRDTYTKASPPKARGSSRKRGQKDLRAGGGGRLQGSSISRTQQADAHTNSHWLWQRTQDLRKLKPDKIPARSGEVGTKSHPQAEELLAAISQLPGKRVGVLQGCSPREATGALVVVLHPGTYWHC